MPRPRRVGGLAGILVVAGGAILVGTDFLPWARLRSELSPVTFTVLGGPLFLFTGIDLVIAGALLLLMGRRWEKAILAAVAIAVAGLAAGFAANYAVSNASYVSRWAHACVDSPSCEVGQPKDFTRIDREEHANIADGGIFDIARQPANDVAIGAAVLAFAGGALALRRPRARGGRIG